MIPQYEPVIDANAIGGDIDAYLKKGGWITEHKETQRFESGLSEFLGIKNCSVVCNGTISLSLALMACGVAAGDDVLIPDLTMVATANAVKLIGANPICVDVEPASLCISISDVSEKITPRTKAIINVTLNGRCGDVESLLFICQSRNISYIEDDAQSFGSKYYDGSCIGSKADVASYSFSMPKIITTGQGGCLATQDDAVFCRIKQLRDFGRDIAGSDNYVAFGINAKFTDLQAIVGLSQMANIEYRIKRKKYIYDFYYGQLNDIVKFIPTDLEKITPWMVDIYSDDRDELESCLLQNKIKTRCLYPTISSLLGRPSCSVAQTYSASGMWLPSSINITDEQLMYVCDKIKEFYES